MNVTLPGQSNSAKKEMGKFPNFTLCETTGIFQMVLPLLGLPIGHADLESEGKRAHWCNAQNHPHTEQDGEASVVLEEHTKDPTYTEHLLIFVIQI